MPHEAPEVKHQILIFGLKVWAFHALNKAETDANFDPAESQRILPRIEGIFDHICKVGSYDGEIDVRDMSRNLAAMKVATVAALKDDIVHTDFSAFCSAYSALSRKTADAEERLPPPKQTCEYSETKQGARYILSSMAHLLSTPFATYRPLPPWAEMCSSDALRAPVERAEKKTQAISSGIGSDAFRNENLVSASRVLQPSNITALPQAVTSLEQLDLFYTDEVSDTKKGCAVAGEDSESSEEEDDWDAIRDSLNAR